MRAVVDTNIPFVSLQRPSPVLLSAPHGARTHRGSRKEDWHEEDEYTAGLALLLSELCGTSPITTVWRTDASRFAVEGPFSAPPERVTALMQALAGFIEVLQSQE